MEIKLFKGYNNPKTHEEIEKELKLAVGNIDWTIVGDVYQKKLMQLQYLLNELPQFGG
jgi:hypothetical protein